jgi:hypothetical protein
VIGGFYVGTAWKEVLYFVVFIAVLLLRPAGLLGQRGAEELGRNAATPGPQFSQCVRTSPRGRVVRLRLMRRLLQ